MTQEPRHIQPENRADVENLDPTLYELSKNDTSKFQAIKRAVWDEMVRRYSESPEEITKIENGLLHRLFIEVTKVDFALGKHERPEAETKSSSILDIINNPGLPPERKREILEAAKQKVAGDLELLEELLNDDLAALPILQHSGEVDVVREAPRALP